MTLPFEKLDHSIIIREESSTNPQHGKYPKDRSIEELLKSGIICLNKPQGPTSHQAADYVKKILKINKAGQTGSLDPNVGGVLPIVLNDATRIAEALLPAGKEYVALMYLHEVVDERLIRSVLKEYQGVITQKPPVRSSVKRVEREREIYDIEVLDIQERHVLFRMSCQGGTYVRKYIDEVGKKLGCNAHMKELVRTKAGPFKDREWCSLQDVQDAFVAYEDNNPKLLKKLLFPLEKAVEHLPKVFIVDSAIDSICNGSVLYVKGVAKLERCITKGSLVAVLSLKGELVSLGTSVLSSDEMLKLKDGLAVKTEKVFMSRGVYPRNKV